MKQKKFTLIELLVVVAIIGVLASLMLPVLGEARKKAQSAVCKSNLKQMSTAAFMYAEDNDNYAPQSGGGGWPYRMRSYIDRKSKSSAYQCPNGVPLQQNYWSTSYGLNYVLSKEETWNPILPSLASNHASETMFFMDAFSSELLMVTYRMQDEEVFHPDAQTRIARHLSKANVAYIDGHVSPLNSASLLKIGTSTLKQIFFTP